MILSRYIAVAVDRFLPERKTFLLCAVPLLLSIQLCTMTVIFVTFVYVLGPNEKLL